MANGWGQPGQYQQGSGQQYPQQQPPWQPQPYSPDPHQRHFQGPPPGYGQVQPYAPLPPYQGQPQYAQPQYAAPRHAPPVAAKSTAAGLILGLHAGRTGIGVLLLAIWLISFPARVLRDRLHHWLLRLGHLCGPWLHDDARVEHRPRHCVLREDRG